MDTKGFPANGDTMAIMRRSTAFFRPPARQMSLPVREHSFPSTLTVLSRQRTAVLAQLGAARVSQRPLLRAAADLDGRIGDLLARSDATTIQASAHFLSQGRTLVQLDERDAAKVAMGRALALTSKPAQRIWLLAEIARIDQDPAA